MESLPNEIILLVLKDLEQIKDIVKFCSTCKKYNLFLLEAIKEKSKSCFIGKISFKNTISKLIFIYNSYLITIKDKNIEALVDSKIYFKKKRSPSVEIFQLEQSLIQNIKELISKKKFGLVKKILFDQICNEVLFTLYLGYNDFSLKILELEVDDDFIFNLVINTFYVWIIAKQVISNYKFSRFLTRYIK